MNENTGKTKKELRKEILKRREALEAEMVAEASAEICHMIQALNMYEEAEDLCLYMPIRNEVDLEILRKAAWEDGKRVWLPKVDGKQMEFHFFGPESRLEEGAYGILEPEAGQVLVPGEATLVVMPGAVFSKSHDRIGYGGGYYDRYLSEHPQCRTMAVCHDLQIVTDCHGAALWMLRQIPVIISSAVSDPVVTLRKNSSRHHHQCGFSRH